MRKCVKGERRKTGFCSTFQTQLCSVVTERVVTEMERCFRNQNAIEKNMLSGATAENLKKFDTLGNRLVETRFNV